MSIEGVNPIAVANEFNFYANNEALTGLDNTLAGQPPSRYTVNPGEVQYWIDGTGAKSVRELFTRGQITDRRDKKMVSGLACLSTIRHMPNAVRQEAYGLLGYFIHAQTEQRAASGTADQPAADAKLNQARAAAWSFLHEHITGQKYQGSPIPLSPDNWPGPVGA